MKTHAFLFLVMLSGLLRAAPLPAGARECYDWFATLGFPEVKGAKWAEVWYGYWFQTGGDSKPQTQTMHGFIVQDDTKNFTVLALDLTVHKLTRSANDTPAHERVAYEERPFLPMITDRLKALQNPSKDGFRRFGAHLGHKTETFALSYFCWRRGETDLAAQLYAEAEKLTAWHSPKPAKAMREAIEIELGHAAMWDAVLRMGGGSLSTNSWGGSGKLEPREQVLEAFRRIVKLFPRCEHIERAKATIAMLERMVAEDAQHPPLTQAQIDAKPLEKRIAELIWLLRDQNGQQMSQPGWCDVLGYGSEGKSAGHQLLKIGYPAAPELIEALTDDRFSRSVGFHRDFHFSHTILTIGDCAQQILSRMTGQDFYAPASTSGYMSNEDKMLAVQKAARAWLADYQKKGLKQMLVDSLSEGKTSPRALVEQLKAADPKAVEPAILAGTAKASTPWLVRQFIDELDTLDSPPSIAAIVTLMKEHGNLEVRLDAAARLLNRDHPDVLSVLLREWSMYQSSKESFDDPFETMADMLACQGSDRAVQALIRDWEARGPGQRLKIVEKIGECMVQKPRTHSFDSRAVPRKPEDAALTRAIALLVTALEDTTTDYGISGGGPELTYGEASIGEFALRALHELAPARFAFTPKAGRRQRHAERIAAANLWRKEHSLPLLPTPPPPGPKLPAADALKIVRVSIQGGELPESSELAIKLRSWESTRFSAQTIPELLVWFAKVLPPGVRGIALEASRENDLTGVEVIARLQTGPDKTGNELDWQHRHSGHCGSYRLGTSSGSSSQSHVQELDCWEDFSDGITKALEQAPETEFLFQAGLSHK